MIMIKGRMTPLELYQARNQRMGSLNYNLAVGTYQVDEDDGTKTYVNVDQAGEASFITEYDEMERVQEAERLDRHWELHRIHESQGALKHG